MKLDRRMLERIGRGEVIVDRGREVVTDDERILLQAVYPRSPRFAGHLPQSLAEWDVNKAAHGPVTDEEYGQWAAFNAAANLILNCRADVQVHARSAARRRRKNNPLTKVELVRRYIAECIAAGVQPKAEAGCLELNVSPRTWTRATAGERRGRGPTRH
jgi:hypothetical protein